MRKSIICLLLFLSACMSLKERNNSIKNSMDLGLQKIERNPNSGFNYPYFLYIPKNISQNQNIRILVQPNNSGKTTDDFNFQLSNAKKSMMRGPKRLANSLNIPVLMPVFPRPQSIGNTYTHALDRDALLIAEGDSLHRLDLQLIAMIQHVKALLSKKGFKIKPKVFMHGFSASGTFTNRFAALHPEEVKAVVTGGLNGLPIFPIDSIQNELLPYPLGIGDIKKLCKKSFDIEKYKEVSQYIYMGSFDRNDTYPYNDAFDDNERRLIKTYFDSIMMPNRWEKSQDIINNLELPIQFNTYNGIRHTITKEIGYDIISFFKANSGNVNNKIEPFVYPYAEYPEKNKKITIAHNNRIYWKDDPVLPKKWRDLRGSDFAINIEEYFMDQDYYQLEELINNAGFKFIIKGENVEITIDRSNLQGIMSSGNGNFQMFGVKLSEDDLNKIDKGKLYKLEPIRKSDKYYWVVNEDVKFIRP